MSNFIEEQNKERTDFTDYSFLHRKVTISTIFCSKLSKGVIFLLIFAIVCPVLVYYFVINKADHTAADTYSCLVERSFRVPCGVENITIEACVANQCCFDADEDSCFHYLPSKYYYHYDDSSAKYTASIKYSPYATKSVDTLQITVSELNENQVSLILHENDGTENATISVTKKNYSVELVETKLMVQVSRNEGDDILLTTSKGALIASDKYWEWSFYMTNQSLFGLGETLIRLDENSTLTKVIYKNQYDHSTLPVFWAHLNGKFHGIVVKCDGPLEIEVLASNLVILRSLTGERIELTLSVGPTPSDLHAQQMGALNLPPYWALGTHICRKSTSADLNVILKEYAENNNSPELDTDCIHENLIMALSKNTDETSRNSFKEYLDNLLTSGKRFLLSLPPHILENSTANTLYAAAQKLDVLYKNKSKIYTGKYLGENVAFPDFTHSSIQQYISELGQFLESNFGIVNISGIVLNENWPVNENYEIKSNESFPYFPQTLRNALSFTIPWNLDMADNTTGQHIKHHNSYGSMQYSLISSYFQNKSVENMFMMSSTKTFGTNYPTVVENESTSWERMNATLRKVLFESISGNHLVSVPICGDTTLYNKALQEVLCMRWYLLAATMPIFRISSLEPYRDPNNLNSGFAAKIANAAIGKRKLLQAYFYTVLSRGEPLVRPMFYDYYEEEETFSMDGQYMLGPHILVAHPFSAGRTKLQIYLPKKVPVWYELFGGNMYKPNPVNSTIVFDILETDWISFIPQGSIVPLMTDSTVNLIVALNCSETPCSASGEVFLNNSYIKIDALDEYVALSNILNSNCNFTLGYIKMYSYDKNQGYQNYYLKNQDMCEDLIGKDYTITHTTELSTIAKGVGKLFSWLGQ